MIGYVRCLRSNFTKVTQYAFVLRILCRPRKPYWLRSNSESKRDSPFRGFLQNVRLVKVLADVTRLNFFEVARAESRGTK